MSFCPIPLMLCSGVILSVLYTARAYTRYSSLSLLSARNSGNQSERFPAMRRNISCSNKIDPHEATHKTIYESSTFFIFFNIFRDIVILSYRSGLKSKLHTPYGIRKTYKLRIKRYTSQALSSKFFVNTSLKWESLRGELIGLPPPFNI